MSRAQRVCRILRKRGGLAAECDGRGPLGALAAVSLPDEASTWEKMRPALARALQAFAAETTRPARCYVVADPGSIDIWLIPA